MLNFIRRHEKTIAYAAIAVAALGLIWLMFGRQPTLVVLAIGAGYVFFARVLLD